MRLTRTAVLALASLSVALVTFFNAAVATENTVHAAGIGYLCFTLVMFGSSLAFWTRARLAGSALYVRWSMVSAASVAAAMGYVPSFSEAILHTVPQRTFQTACFNAGEALYMLAALLSFAAVPRLILVIDLVQALLFVVLRFNLAYSSVTSDHFTGNHLLVGQLVALFLFLIALVGCLGAGSRAELNFLSTLSWFLGLRLVAFFLSNQVSYTWRHYENCSLWDVPGTALVGFYSLYLVYTSRSAMCASTETMPLRAPGVMVRSLMPSFFALVNLVLGLFLLRVSMPLAAVAISVSLVFYVARTVLLQSQSVHERTLLESRNLQLEGLAVRDPLTGIGNRRSLAGVYGRLQVSSDEALSLLLMDVDNFKQANDQHGHLYGDQVLVNLARKLETLAGRIAGSHCARFGGDEFAVLLLGVSPQQAAALAEELRIRFAAHSADRPGGEVSLSIGVASLRAARDLPLEGLVSSADRALYRAKLLGRNRVEAEPLPGPDPSEAVVVMELGRSEA